MNLPARVPPHNLDAERAALGAVLIEGREAMPRVVEVLRTTDFYTDAHRVVYQAMLNLFDRGAPVDIITLQDELRKNETLTAAGGPAALALLVEQGSVSAYLASYTSIVRDMAALRELIQAATYIVTSAFEGSADAKAVIDDAEQRIFALADRRLQGKALAVKSILNETFQRLEELYNSGSHLTGVPTGIDRLDMITAGLQKTDLILVAGRPSTGKTAFAMALAQHAGIRLKLKVLILSMEMSNTQLVQRMLSSEGRVDSIAVRTGRLEPADWHRLTQAAGRLSEAPIFLDDTPGLSALDVRAKARRVKAEHGLDLLVIDYLQLMRGAGENRQQEVSDISRSLKGLAKELDVPVVALSQLSRAIELRGDSTPRLSDLRESGSLEQDADVIMFLHRPPATDKNPESAGVCEVHIGKQRNGPTGKIEVAFVSKYARFENMAAADRAGAPEDAGARKEPW